MDVPHNRHHLFSERVWYKSPCERSFRQHPLLIIPMLVPIHADLHAELPHPPKPNARLIHGALEFLGGLPDTTRNAPLDVVSALSEHFYAQDTKLAVNIGNNLCRQLVHLQDGIYEN